MRRFLFFLFLLALVSCNAPPPPITAKIGGEVNLKWGQTATFDDGLVVTFENVPTDGRCSSCTASFYAAVNLRVTVPGKAPTVVTLKTPPEASVDGDVSPYVIKFVKLQPQKNYPNDSLNRADYVVTLQISKTN